MLNGVCCALKNIVFQAASLLVYDPIKRRFFPRVFVLQAGPPSPADGERPSARSKCSAYMGATQRRRRPFLRHFNSFVISACQTWLERRTIASEINLVRCCARTFVCFSSFFPFTSPSWPPLWLDITLRLSRQPSNMTDLMTEEQ